MANKQRLSVWESSKRLQDKLDVHKRWPGYFNVWIFRGAIVLMALVFGAFAISYGWDVSAHVYVECPADTLQGRCANPFYTKADCALKGPDAVLCSKETFFAGESYGEKPSWLHNNFEMLGLLVAALAFGLNHLLYWRRTGKWSYSR